MAVEDQVLMLFTAVRGDTDDPNVTFLSDIPVDKVVAFHGDFIKFMHTQHPEVGKKIAEQKKLDDALEAEIKSAIKEFKETVTYKIAAE